MALVIGIIFGFILYLANQKPDHYRDPRAKRKRKVTTKTTKATVDEGISLAMDLEKLVLIDDFEEEVLDDDNGREA